VRTGLYQGALQVIGDERKTRNPALATKTARLGPRRFRSKMTAGKQRARHPGLDQAKAASRTPGHRKPMVTGWTVAGLGCEVP